MDEGPRRYAAFLSYCHKDAAAARAVHRRLESYRIPRRLVGSAGERGPVPARLVPIFRDREELPAAGDLSVEVRAALAASDALVILCSPAAAASQWVAKEIDTFRSLHPDRPVIAAILDGEPAAAFPPNLAAGGIEPLAADLRSGRDGKRLGLLKLVAGLSGVHLDALVQRDAQRRLRRVTAVTAVAVAAMLAMAILTAVALTARAEAQRQRAEAEGLVEFMLTDLRDRLRGVGRLDVMTAASRRALAYYEGQPLRDLPPASLERRARILHALGEDEVARGNLNSAGRLFEEAAAATSRLLADEPGDLQRIYVQAQSEFWIGATDLRRHRFESARQAFVRYKRLAEQLVAGEPSNPKWSAELGYAEGNLCTVEVDAKGDLEAALRSCTASLKHLREAAHHSADPEVIAAIPNRYGWIADVYRGRADLPKAYQMRLEQETLLAVMRRKDPLNLDTTEMWLTNQTATAEIELQLRNKSAALRRLHAASVTADALTSQDPTNQTWAARKKRVLEDIRQELTTARRGI